MDLRLGAALVAGRLAAAMARHLGQGGGTVLPGHVVTRLQPNAARQIAARLTHGVVLVSGTNGKTTTARMVAELARAGGLTPIHNRSGANLMAGITAALAAHSTLRGTPSGEIGVFEVDEANLPSAIATTRPRLVALTNLFRDQLDRYGEVDQVAAIWQRAVRGLAPRATLVLNADDPAIAALQFAAPGPVLTFGMEHHDVGGPIVGHDADRRLCPHCGTRLGYAWIYYGHVGHYRCPGCDWQRPTPALAGRGLSEDSHGRAQLTIAHGDESLDLALPLRGLYNAYNALAAFAISRALGMPTGATVAGLERVTAVFGRQEAIRIGSGTLTLTLVKNPVGFNQVLRTLNRDPMPDLVVIAINDRFADGTDVSWLWDVDFELLATQPARILCSGLRAEDMALRLKYALVPDERVVVVAPLEAALDAAISAAAQGAHVAVLPTYSAMLTLRRALQRRGHVGPFWEA